MAWDGLDIHWCPKLVGISLCGNGNIRGSPRPPCTSQLDFFFNHHGLGEKEVFLHADNCSGQNKNSTMLQYLAWRVMTKRHTQITLSFLVVGHTKFAPDWCFGLFKRLYRKTKLGSLRAIAQVTDDSAKCNFAELNIDENGTIVVPTYDWAGFLAPRFRKFSGIKKFHHFRFVSSELGVVYARKHSDTAEEKVKLLKNPWSPPPTELPDRVSQGVCPRNGNGTSTRRFGSIVLRKTRMSHVRSQQFPGPRAEQVPRQVMMALQILCRL